MIDSRSNGPDEPDEPDERRPIELSRRQVLGLGAAAASAAAASTFGAPSPADARPLAARSRASLGASAQAGGVAGLRPTIHPRSDWAGELGVKGDLIPETDVRFLLVHHTASTNNYGPDDVGGQIRGFYDFHTGPEKGWPDVAYNFFVDRYGGIWEGRQGSLTGPVRGDATGGSQGFALLSSLIGNHHDEPMTAEAMASLTQLLAWLGATYEVDTSVGAKTTFISRGSNLWPAGTEVTARTISGHREMSTTTCPGDFVYPLLAEEVPSAVSAVRAAGGSTTSSTPSSTSSSTTSSTVDASPSTTSASTVGQSAELTDPTTTPPTIGPEAAQARAERAAREASDTGSDDPSWPLVIVGGALAAVAAGVGAVSRFLPSSKRSQ